MPELPEVETVCRGLRPHLVGRVLRQIDQRRPDLRFPFPSGFRDRLADRRVVAVDRRAKYILIHLDDGAVWLVHLGMSGRFVVNGVAGAASSSAQRGHNSGWAFEGRHDHLVVQLDDGAVLTFNDPRRFGFMDLFPGAALDRHPRLSGLGPEPLDAAFDVDYLNRALAAKKTPIKAALLDQALVAGLGNIYVCEALWHAGLSPRRTAATVPGKRAARLVPAIKSVLAAAIDAGGSSLRDFVHATGELGYFQHRWQVYDREGAACRRPGCAGTVSRIVQSGRSTFYCPGHQR